MVRDGLIEVTWDKDLKKVRENISGQRVPQVQRPWSIVNELGEQERDPSGWGRVREGVEAGELRGGS